MHSEYIAQLRNAPRFFWMAVAGILLINLGQWRIEKGLRSKNAMPETRWWQSRSLDQKWQLIKIHRDLFPSSPWRIVGAVGLGLFLLSFLIVF